MEKLKIAVVQAGSESTDNESLRRLCENPTLLELCTPVARTESAALRDLEEGIADAMLLVPTAGPVQCPIDATQLIVTDKTNFLPLNAEPTAADIIRFRDILERDLDLSSPRIAIVSESTMKEPDLANQVTAEQGINTYGPYTVEQILSEDLACHFDGIVTTNGEKTCQRIISDLALEAPVRFYAGGTHVVTALYSPVTVNEDEESQGLADFSALTHPIYTAIDIVRNRAHYDQARQNPLPKLYHDKRDDRRKDNAPQANSKEKDDKEQAS